VSADSDPNPNAAKFLSLIGRTPDSPLSSLEWPGTEKPKSWWGRNSSGQLTKVYRDYAAYCDD